ncbi:MAG: polysaccharide pyruvyl transferase family protein, partial [Eubacterium sp.]
MQKQTGEDDEIYSSGKVCCAVFVNCENKKVNYKGIEYMKKIGILTFHRADNYGAVLQNYGLLKALENCSENVIVKTIDYRSEAIEKPYNLGVFEYCNTSFYRYIKNVIKNIVYYTKINERKKRFNDFRLRLLNLTRSYCSDELNNDNEEFDLYIVGSDQVWSSKITHNDTIYTLDFVKNSRKISYAASSGCCDYISAECIRKIMELNCISVREGELRNYLIEYIDKEIRRDIDPVFLIDKDKWSELINKERSFEDKFIFVYSVGDRHDEVYKITRSLAEKYGYKIVGFANSKKRKRDKTKYICKSEAGPLDFL